MEHGLYVLEGKAVYLLNRDWVEVQAGDFMWLRAFCPQACYAGGPGRFRYLLYKDVNRHPTAFPRMTLASRTMSAGSSFGMDNRRPGSSPNHARSMACPGGGMTRPMSSSRSPSTGLRARSPASPAHTTALDWLRDLGPHRRQGGLRRGGVRRLLGAGGPSRTAARRRSQWTAINACLVPAAALDGQEVVTAEGLGTPDDLHPVQRELAERGGSQCGYCTPGFVCSMAAEFYRAGPGCPATATPSTGPTGSTCTR